MITSYDDFDDMMAAMAEAEEAANARASIWQKSISSGYFIQFAEVYGHPLVIFHDIPTREAFAQAGRLAGASEEELEWSLESFDERFARGYRFARSYSVATWDGCDMGDVHVSNLDAPLTWEQWVEAEEAGWNHETLLAPVVEDGEVVQPPTPRYPWFVELVRRLA